MAKKGLFNRFKSLFIRYDIIPVDVDDLNAAILTGNEDEVERILGEGVKPDEADDLGRLPLHFATEKNKPILIAILIKKGAVINLMDENGNTALMEGAKADTPEACRKLIKLGIDYFLQNNKEQTALDIALSLKHKKIVELFTLRLKELELIIAKKRNEQAAKYSSLSNIELGIENAGAGGRVQTPRPGNEKKATSYTQKKTLPELELEYARLEKMLRTRIKQD